MEEHNNSVKKRGIYGHTKEEPAKIFLISRKWNSYRLNPKSVSEISQTPFKPSLQKALYLKCMFQYAFMELNKKTFHTVNLWKINVWSGDRIFAGVRSCQWTSCIHLDFTRVGGWGLGDIYFRICNFLSVFPFWWHA